jgi:hypothetical protein
VFADPDWRDHNSERVANLVKAKRERRIQHAMQVLRKIRQGR